MKDVVIVGALRTPIGCFRGALAGHSAVELGSLVVKALIAFLQSRLMTSAVPDLKHCIWLLRRYSVARLILSSPVARKT